MTNVCQGDWFFGVRYRHPFLQLTLHRITLVVFFHPFWLQPGLRTFRGEMTWRLGPLQVVVNPRCSSTSART